MVLAQSGFETAHINLRSIPAGYYLDLDVHIDKSDKDILCIKEQNLNESVQKVFLITLKGPSTIYYLQSKEAHKEVINSCKEFDYICKYQSSEPFEYKFPPQRVLRADDYHGSVHLAGFHNGSIHAPPITNEQRVIISIKPSSLEDVGKIQDLASWGWEIPQ